MLLKSLVDYKIKTSEFEHKLLSTTVDKAGEFTVK